MEDIIIIAKYLQDSGLLVRRVSPKIENKTKEQRHGFLGMFLGTLGTCLGNVLAGKGLTAMSQGQGILRASWETQKQDF